MKRLVRSIVALLLAAPGCRDDAQTLPGVARPPPVLADVHLAPEWVTGQPVGAGAPWSLEPADPAAYGLRGPVRLRVLRALPGTALRYEVADATSAVLLEREEGGATRALRSRALAEPNRTQSLRGAWEAWWDGALWVRRLEPEAEARRYEVPGVLDGALVFAWGEEAVGALVDLADGRHLLRLDPDGPPQDMGWVASYADVVVTSWRVCLVLSPDGTATLIAEDGERLPATVPPGYQPGRMVGTRVTYVEFAGPGPTLWVDHAIGVQRVLQGRRARYEGPSASPPRFGLTNSADGLFVFDMETGEERLVPNSAFIWPNGFIVSADGTRVFGRDIQATYGVLLDAETGVELARFEGLEAVSVADFVGADQVILRDGWSDPPTSIRLTLSTGAREVWPGSWLARWGDADLLTEEGGSELWVLGVGREPWRILQGDSWWTGPEPIGSTGLILADAGDEAAVVDLERGPIWRGAHRLRISGDQAWSCDPVGFLDVDVSVPVLRTAEVSGTCQLWPARSSVTIQDGDTLSEVYADGGRVVVRELGEYEAVAYSYPAGPDLWATRGGDLYRFGPDGQAVLRWHLPEYSFLQLWSVDGRALLQTSGPAGTELFSIAAEGPVEGFRIEARELAIPGTFPLPPMDDQGRILVPEDGRLVARGAEGAEELLLERPGLEVTGVKGVGGRWVAYAKGAQGSEVWWTGPEGLQHEAVAAVPMDGYVSWSDGPVAVVRAGPLTFTVEPAQGRIMKVASVSPPTSARITPAGGRWLVGERADFHDLWVWDSTTDSVVSLRPPGLSTVTLGGVVR